MVGRWVLGLGVGDGEEKDSVGVGKYWMEFGKV